MEASLAVQTRIVARLKEAARVVALVPAANVFDKSSRPERFPCIIVGEAEAIGDDADCIVSWDVAATIHVWAADQSFETVKSISGAVQRALRSLADEVEIDGYSVGPIEFEAARYLRDPNGVHTHGVLTFTSIVEDVAEDAA